MDEWKVMFRALRKIISSTASWEDGISRAVALVSRHPDLFNDQNFWDRVDHHDFRATFDIVTHWAKEGLERLDTQVGWETLLLDLGDCPESFRLVVYGFGHEIRLVPQQEALFAGMPAEERMWLAEHNVRDLDDDIIGWNRYGGSDYGDNNGYWLWLVFGSFALISPLRNIDYCKQILRGRDHLYLICGFEGIFTYFVTVTPEGLRYEYGNSNVSDQQFSETAPFQGVFLFELARLYGWEPSATMNAQNEPDDEEALLTRETCHPRAAELLKEPFYFDCTDEFSPHGNDTGADTLAFFRTWRVEHPDASPLVFLDELMASWGCMNAHWDDSDSVQIQKQIRKDEFGLLVRDDTVIGLAFAQIVVEGAVEQEIKRRALLAIDRQSLPAMVEFRCWTLPRQRLEKLAAMRAALEVALESDPPNLPQREE